MTWDQIIQWGLNALSITSVAALGAFTLRNARRQTVIQERQVDAQEDSADSSVAHTEIERFRVLSEMEARTREQLERQVDLLTGKVAALGQENDRLKKEFASFKIERDAQIADLYAQNKDCLSTQLRLETQVRNLENELRMYYQPKDKEG